MTTALHPCRLILIWHGEAHCNVDNVVCGERTCTGLTDTGRQQAKQLGDLLAQQEDGHRISALYSTRASRAVHTAEIVGADIGRTVLAELTAPNYDAVEGNPWPDVIAAFGQTPALAPHLPLAAGAECWISMVQRTSRELEVIMRRHLSETVLVVAHEETVIAAAQYFLRLLPWSRAEATLRVDHTSQTVWQRERLSWSDPEEDRWRWVLVRASDTWHLAELAEPRSVLES